MSRSDRSFMFEWLPLRQPRSEPGDRHGAGVCFQSPMPFAVGPERNCRSIQHVSFVSRNGMAVVVRRPSQTWRTNLS